MDREQLLNIILGSDIFKGLDPALQKEILEAPLPELQRYTQIFTDANAMLAPVYKNFIQKIDGVLQQFTLDLKKVKKSKLERDETQDKQQQQQTEEELLKQLQEV